ncbi:MAG: exosortase/archaeosortase family protein [Bacteroidales bacterium]|jgi:exosortase/archaeosortase family protein|nr:exosortase/archaeosortase family protein [Bacteroidales bacterium]
MNLKDIKSYCKDPKNRNTVNVGLFIVLIISFHFIYLGWQALDYWPVEKWVNQLMVWSVNMLYSQACWVLDHVFHIDLTTITSARLLATTNSEGGWARVVIAPECASLKQWMHWIFLMVLFPGPWKHKLWYIPIGLVIIEWTNVIRICGILMMQIPWPNSFHIAHDYIFKVFFYFVIFLMWVLWVEKFYNPTLKAKQHE